MIMSVNDVPMMIIRMRCPECLFDYRFLVEMTTPLAALPEITKQTMRCNCKDHVPKINNHTPVEKSLMSINAVPFKKLREDAILKSAGYGAN